MSSNRVLPCAVVEMYLPRLAGPDDAVLLPALPVLTEYMMAMSP